MLKFDTEVAVGEVREWLKPRGYDGEYHRFIVLERYVDDHLKEFAVKIRYPNGLIDELYESDLLRADDEDDEDWEYSVKIEDAEEHYAEIRKNSHSILQG